MIPSNTLPPTPIKESHVIDDVIGSSSQQTLSNLFVSYAIVATQNPSYVTLYGHFNTNVIQAMKGKSQ